jgi:hypothetical protein
VVGEHGDAVGVAMVNVAASDRAVLVELMNRYGGPIRRACSASPRERWPPK